MLALIDGDVLCYNACESRFTKDEKGNWKINLRNMNGDEDYTEEEKLAYLNKSWFKLQDMVKMVCDSVFADDFLMAVKGPDNFRNILFPEYKLHRHRNKTSETVPKLREMAISSGLAIGSNGREADDLLRIWATQANAAGDEYIVCTIDKDLKCIPGNHYTFDKGSISGTINQIDEITALRFYYEQLLKGDPTDNIPGIPGIGPKKAEAILACYETEEDFQEAVVEAYMSFYDDKWYEYLLSNGKMIYLQKEVDDYFKCSHWPVVRELLYNKEDLKTTNIENKDNNDRPKEVNSPSICDPIKIRIFKTK